MYKTEFINKVQSTYILIKANVSEVSLREIKKLVTTNPFTDGLKSLMLAIKGKKKNPNKMYEDAIEKLFHIKYYYVEAILLYCKYLKSNGDDIIFNEWLNKGKKLALNYHYRFLLHKFICLEKEIDSLYDENNYSLPEKIDYSEVFK